MFLKLISTLSKETSSALRLAADAMKRNYDRHRREAPVLAAGTLVLLDGDGINTLRPSKKLDDHCHGPFKVLECVGLQSYCLQLPSSWLIHDVFHISKLTPFTASPVFPSQQATPVIPPVLADEAPTLSKILEHRALRNSSRYLILLSGQDDADATWVSLREACSFRDPNNVLGAYVLTR